MSSSYSKTLSIIYVTYAKHKKMWKGHPNIKKSVLQNLTMKWVDNSVDPPFIESISNYFSE